jgi:hypothetical protein
MIDMATLYPILDRVVSLRNQRWKIRRATSISVGMNCIIHAIATGSIGCKDYIMSDKDGEDILVADVVQVNSDGSERQPYAKVF